MCKRIDDLLFLLIFELICFNEYCRNNLNIKVSFLRNKSNISKMWAFFKPKKSEIKSENELEAKSGRVIVSKLVQRDYE